MSRIQKQPKKQTGRINPAATELKKVIRPSVCFYHMADTVAKLEQLEQGFLTQMFKQFKVLSSIEWNDISKYKGLGWDSVPERSMRFKIPVSVGKKELFHIKITQKGRVWGYRDGDAFQLVWFDPNHQVTPE